MNDHQLLFSVPWADIKAAFVRRAERARAAAEDAQGKDPCNQGIKQMAELDAELYGLLAKYSEGDGHAHLNVRAITDIFLARPRYGPSQIVAESGSAPSW